jgi:hypothetical protein
VTSNKSKLRRYFHSSGKRKSENKIPTKHLIVLADRTLKTPFPLQATDDDVWGKPSLSFETGKHSGEMKIQGEDEGGWKLCFA